MGSHVQHAGATEKRSSYLHLFICKIRLTLNRWRPNSSDDTLSLKKLFQSFACCFLFLLLMSYCYSFTIKYIQQWLPIWMPYFRGGFPSFMWNPISDITVQFAKIHFSLKVFPIAVVRCNCETLFPFNLIIHGALYSLTDLSVLWRCNNRVSQLQCMPGIPENWNLH